MNKSKFLKKSLAALLAVLMVVAMVPLSAAAADNTVPPVSNVFVDNKKADISGSNYTVELVKSASLPTVSVELNANQSGMDGSVWHDDGTGKDSNAQKDSVQKARWTFTLLQDEYDKGEAKFKVFSKDNNNHADYTIKINFVSGSSDTSIKSIGFTDVANQYGATEQDDKGVYIITGKYDATTANITLELNSEDANLTSVATGATTVSPTKVGTAKWNMTSLSIDTVYDATVTAQDGTVNVYHFKVVIPTFFKSISTPDEYKAAEVKLTPSKEVMFYLPFATKIVKDSTNAEFYEIPVNFELGYPSATLKTVMAEYPNLAPGSEKEIKSGDKIYVPKASLSTGLTVIYTYNTSTTDTASVNFTFKGTYTNVTDPKAFISDVKVGNYTAKIDEATKTITLELPASYMNAAGSNSTDLFLKGAKGATVSLAGAAAGDSNAVATLTNNDFTEKIQQFNASKESTNTLRVVSGQAVDGKNAAADYTLIVKKVGIDEPAEMKVMKLEDPDGKQYTAEISGNTIKFKLPYSSEKATLSTTDKEWKLYYEVSKGAYVQSPALISSGGKLLASETATLGIFPAIFDGKVDIATPATPIKVVAADNSTKEYNLVVEKLPAATGHSITKFSVTHDSSNKLDKIDKTDIFEGKISGNKVVVNVPYSSYVLGSKDFAAASGVATIFEVSEGAKIYYVTDSSDGSITKLTGATEETNASKITVDGADFNGEETTPGSGKYKELTLVVVSEGAGVLSSSKKYDNTWQEANAGKYTEYKLQVKRDPAREKAELSSIKIFNDKTKEEVVGKINTTAETIVFDEVPFHFIADNASLYLDFDVKNGEGVAISTENNIKDQRPSTTTYYKKPLVYKEDGHRNGDVTSAAKNVNLAGLAFKTGSTTEAVLSTYKYLYIESENGEMGNSSGVSYVSHQYEIKYNVAEPEQGATLNSVTINGVTASPVGNKVTIQLPLGTEVTSLKPTFNVSKYAVIKSNGNPVTNGEDSFNFSYPRTFVVESESGKNTTTYTVEVKTAETFKDVPVGAWFHDAVMAAYNAGIINGRGNGIFDPYGNVTRAEFATMMAKAKGFDTKTEITNPFSDMKGYNSAMSNAVAWCAQQGYISGYGDTTFRPGQTITRQEMAVMLAKVLELDVEKGSVTSFADDAKIGNWAKPAVKACNEAKIIVGEGNNTFNPQGKTIRAAAAMVSMKVKNAK